MSSSAKEIRGRLTSVSSIRKITKAMELIAASRMRRAADRTKAARAYELSVWRLGVLLAAQVKLDPVNPLRRLVHTGERADKHLLLVITGNRGLCGQFNGAIVRVAINFVAEKGADKVEVVCLGKKGAEILQAKGVAVSRLFERDDVPKNSEAIMSVTDYLFYKMREGRTDRIWVTGGEFVSSFEQRPLLKPVYPLVFDKVAKETTKVSSRELSESLANISVRKRWYRFEPKASVILENLVLAIGESRVYQALLESSAGEQAARMLAMQSAHKAAGEMHKKELSAFNKYRQGSITRELSEISAARAAMGQ